MQQDRTVKVTRGFVNELGNSVTVEVDRSGSEVAIRVIGPSSTGENVLTRLEAVRVYEALGEVLTERAMGTRCVAHQHREWVPLEHHHVWPTGHGGPNVAGNLEWLCANGHGAVHDLLERMLKAAGGRVSWAVRRRYGRGVRRVAQLGYDRIQRGAL